MKRIILIFLGEISQSREYLLTKIQICVYKFNMLAPVLSNLIYDQLHNKISIYFVVHHQLDGIINFITKRRNKMKIRKKFLTLATTVSIGVLAACGNSNSDNTQENKIELEVMTWDSVQQDGVQKAIDAFEDQNPNINVNLETIPSKGDMLVKLNASLESGKAPDVFWQSYEASTYVEAGVLEPLDEYIKQDNMDLSNYNSKIVDLYNMNDQQYGIPKDMDAWFIIYNTKLFDELGVDYPTDNWTWEQMVDIASQLKGKMKDDQYPLWFDTGVRNGFGSLVEQLGGHIVTEKDGTLTTDLNNGTGQEAFKKLI